MQYIGSKTPADLDVIINNLIQEFECQVTRSSHLWKSTDVYYALFYRESIKLFTIVRVQYFDLLDYPEDGFLKLLKSDNICGFDNERAASKLLNLLVNPTSIDPAYLEVKHDHHFK